MAATLDDILFAASAHHTSLTSYLDRFEAHLGALVNDIAWGFAALRIDVRGLKGSGPGGGTPPGGGAGGGSGATPPGAFEAFVNGPAKFLALFAALEKGITSFGNAVGRFVGQASPAHILRWKLAVADLEAVIGRALIPVMEKATFIVRKLADAFANLSPESQKLVAGFATGAGVGAVIAGIVAAGRILIGFLGPVPALIATVAGAFAGVATTTSSGRAILRAFEGVLKSVTQLFDQLARVLVPLLEAGLTPALDALAEAISNVTDGVRGLVNGARELFGLDPLKGDKSSVGAAVRGAQIGDIQSFINRAYTNAFQGGVNSVEERQLEELKGIRALIAKSNPLLPRADSWASGRSGLERADRALGGSGSVGRGVGTVLDAASAPFTAPARFAVETMRQLFG